MNAEVNVTPASHPLNRPLPDDKRLRSRVKLFGNILGKILHDHAGDKVFNAVEALRKGHISLRKTDDIRKRQRLAALVESLDSESLAHVVRSFSIYFSLVNIAEEAFQHKQRRREVSPRRSMSRSPSLVREYSTQGPVSRRSDTS